MLRKHSRAMFFLTTEVLNHIQYSTLYRVCSLSVGKVHQGQSGTVTIKTLTTHNHFKPPTHTISYKHSRHILKNTLQITFLSAEGTTMLTLWSSISARIQRPRCPTMKRWNSKGMAISTVIGTKSWVCTRKVQDKANEICLRVHNTQQTLSFNCTCI